MHRPLVAIGTLLALGAPIVGHAQGGVGVKAGLSYETASSSGVAPGSTNRSGFAVGIGAVTGGVLGLGIEALYAQRGFSNSAAGNARRLDYIDLPVYVRLALPIPLVSPFAYVGPQGSYELQCGTGSGDCPDTGRPKVTYAGVIGGGVRLGLLGGLSIEGRYVYGLTDLNLSTVQSAASYKTRSLLLLVGLGF